MVNRFVQLLEILFPPRADQLIISKWYGTDVPYQAACTQGVWSTTKYNNQIIKAAILENKFQRNTKAAEMLAQPLERFITEKNIEQAIFVPIALSKKRLRDRGHNQTTSVLHCLSKNIIICDNLLLRVRETVPQMKLQRSQRLKNLQNAFVVNLALVAELQGSSTIVLVDDVVTTGATLFEAKVTLASHFPNTNIICLAIAH